MAFAGIDAGEEKQTPFTFRGKPIVLSKTRGTSYKGRSVIGRNDWAPEGKKQEVMALFFATADIKQSAELAKIPATLLKRWLREDWARDLLEEMRQENALLDELETRALLKETRSQLLDRLKNGDEIVTKGGQKVRKKLSGRDLSTIGNSNFQQNQLIQGKPTSRSDQGALSEKKMTELRNMFLEFAGKRLVRPTEVIEGEVIVEPIPNP